MTSMKTSMCRQKCSYERQCDKERINANVSDDDWIDDHQTYGSK